MHSSPPRQLAVDRQGRGGGALPGKALRAAPGLAPPAPPQVGVREQARVNAACDRLLAAWGRTSSAASPTTSGKAERSANRPPASRRPSPPGRAAQSPRRGGKDQARRPGVEQRQIRRSATGPRHRTRFSEPSSFTGAPLFRVARVLALPPTPASDRRRTSGRRLPRPAASAPAFLCGLLMPTYRT